MTRDYQIHCDQCKQRIHNVPLNIIDNTKPDGTSPSTAHDLCSWECVWLFAAGGKTGDDYPIAEDPA